MKNVSYWRGFSLLATAVLVFSLAFERSGLADQHDGPCAERHVEAGNTTVFQRLLRDQCMISVRPENSGMTYRSYVFSSRGIFLVFNSFGDGSNSSSTGGRAYFIFPRKNIPSFDILSTGDVEVRLASGGTIHFSAEETKILSMSGQEFREDRQINRNNNGGVEILSSNTLILDTGFQVGEVGYMNPKRTSVFTDKRGVSCQVVNGEIFKYPPNNAFLAFATDQELKDFLEVRCPRLDLESLL